MVTFTANDAKQSFGRVLDAAQREPVLIRKHNHTAAVILSPMEYERLRGINVAEFAAFCNLIGSTAVANGLTENKLAELLTKV